MTDAQDGTIHATTPLTVHLDDGLIGTIDRTATPICDVRGTWWTCILPPGHECAHLRVSDEMLARSGPLRVTRLVGKAAA